ncbi:MAG: hypothetical protein KGK11_13545 [Sphingomonadales bacterium]|nr:hypothetical protein [Sphingomonadales bacterium]
MAAKLRAERVGHVHCALAEALIASGAVDVAGQALSDIGPNSRVATEMYVLDRSLTKGLQLLGKARLGNDRLVGLVHRVDGK